LLLYTVIHASGQTYAHAAQPVQFSGFCIFENAYPLAFVSLERDSTLEGHATTHKSHPLHLSVFITTAPCNFAIVCVVENLGAI